MSRKQRNQRNDCESVFPAVRDQYLRLPPHDQRQFRRVLREASRLDDSLADLRLVLPTIEVCFYSATNKQSFTPREVINTIRRWHATYRLDVAEATLPPDGGQRGFPADDR